MCRRNESALTSFRQDVASGDLPDVAMLIPNSCHDAHNCSLSVADAWLKHQMRAIENGPDWASGRLAVVITTDEDDGHHRNRILTVVVHPSLHGTVATTRLSHYSLSRALAELAGVRPLAEARRAHSLLAAFGLRPPG
jgi:acid phosphatase